MKIYANKINNIYGAANNAAVSSGISVSGECVAEIPGRLSDLNIRARYSDLNYNRILSLRKRIKKRLLKSIALNKQKAAERMPAFSGAVGVSVLSFTTLGIIAAESRNFNFAVGGEIFLAAILGFITYKLLKKLGNN